MLDKTLNEAVTADGYAHHLAGEIKPRFAFTATDSSALHHWQQALRAALIDRLGIPHIAARCTDAPRAVQRDEQRLDDHVREEWELETEPGFRTPFFLLRPLDVDRPLPLVLTPHGHNARGRFIYSGIAQTDQEQAEITEGERDIAYQAVRAGYVAIAPEARAFDESRTRRDTDNNARDSCYDRQMRAMMFGRTLLGERVWDLMRLIDYAATRPEIDATRVAVTGNSGGGTATLFAAAVDTRVSVAIPGSFFCTFLDSIGSIHHCVCNLVPHVMELAEMHDIAGLIAPRPFLAVNGRQDTIFPADAARRAFERLKAIYTVAGAADRCELFFGDGGHRYYKQPVWPFLQHWL